jgi:hypothetical protein
MNINEYMKLKGFGVAATFLTKHQINALILYLIGPWSARIFGKLYIEQSKNPNSLIKLMVVLSSGMFIHGILNIVAYLRSDYYLLYSYYRQTVDFWRGELVNVKTTEMLFVFATGIALGVLFSSCKKQYKYMSIFVVMLSVIVSIFLANRALLIMVAFVFIWRCYCWFSDVRISSTKKAIYLLFACMILSTLFFAISLNIAGLGDYIKELKIVQRFTSGLELTRFDVWELFFKDFKFIEYPFGGKILTKNSQWSYLHNMWLDVYNVVGIIPFMILIIVTIIFIITFVRSNRIIKITPNLLLCFFKNSILIFWL